MDPVFVRVGALVRYRLEELDNWLSKLPTSDSRPAKRYLEVTGD